MRKILLACFLLVLAGKANAACRYSWIEAWPLKKELSTNPVIILNCNGAWRERLLTWKDENAIYLKSGNSVVRLNVIEVHEGKDDLIQFILRPQQALITGKTYTLTTLSDGKYESFGNENFEWKVVNGRDRNTPVWLQEPVYSHNRIVFFGCGPEKYARFCACFRDKSEIIIHTRLKRLSNGKVSEFYHVPDSSFIRVGFGMCSGEFDMVDGEKYEVAFALMDASGNKTRKTSPIAFVAPTDQDVLQDNDEAICDCTQFKKQGDGDFQFYTILVFFIVLLVIGATVFFIVRKRMKK